MTDRARREAARQVGQDGTPVAPVARAFGVGWQTVMRAVDDVAAETFDEQGLYTLQSRICLALGVDEKVMNRAGPGRRRRYVTVLVNLATGWPLDIIEGRSKRLLKAWLAAPDPDVARRRPHRRVDPAAPYRAALS